MAYIEEQLDEDMCCVLCGEHFSDPHAPQCPSHPFLLDEEEDSEGDETDDSA